MVYMVVVMIVCVYDGFEMFVLLCVVSYGVVIGCG